MRKVFRSSQAGVAPVKGEDCDAYGAASRDYTPRFKLAGAGMARRCIRGALWTAFTFALMAGTVHVLLDPPAFLLARPATPETPSASWTPIRQPIPVYSFSGGPFGRPADQYAATRHTDGSRIDTLTFGRFDGGVDAPWMRISLHRISGPVSDPPGFFVDMARLASIDGLSVGRTTVADLMPTRFGNFAVADLEVRGPGSRSVCLGYRMELMSPAFRVTGITCGTVSNPIDRRMLACTLNRLDVLSARDDRELSGFFARSELERGSNCEPRKLAASGSRTAWLDHASPKQAVDAMRLKSLPARMAQP